MLDDLENLIDYARRVKWIDEKFAMFGHSRGGGAAILYTADRTDVTALATWAAISHVNRWTAADALDWRRRGFREVVNSRTGETLLLGTDLLDEVEMHLAAKVNILSAAGRVHTPWLIVHGTADETVPHSEAEELHERSVNVSTLRLVEGGNHGFGAMHPLTETPPLLEEVVTETVKFFAENSAR